MTSMIPEASSNNKRLLCLEDSVSEIPEKKVKIKKSVRFFDKASAKKTEAVVKTAIQKHPRGPLWQEEAYGREWRALSEKAVSVLEKDGKKVTRSAIETMMRQLNLVEEVIPHIEMDEIIKSSKRFKMEDQAANIGSLVIAGKMWGDLESEFPYAARGFESFNYDAANHLFKIQYKQIPDAFLEKLITTRMLFKNVYTGDREKVKEQLLASEVGTFAILANIDTDGEELPFTLAWHYEEGVYQSCTLEVLPEGKIRVEGDIGNRYIMKNFDDIAKCLKFTKALS